MNLDDLARSATAAASKRSREVAPHRRGLERKPWVVPVGLVGAAGVVLFVLAIGLTFADRPDRGATVADPVNAEATVELVTGPILAGYVSASGEISVLMDDGESTVVQLTASEGAPVFGDETIPEPRWLQSGRVVEYVTEIDAELWIVRVDVRTGRATSEPYWVIQSSGDVSTSPPVDGPAFGSIALMRSADGVSVRAVRDQSGFQWELRSFRDDLTILLPAGSIRFLAPTSAGLVVIVDGVLGTIDGDGEVTPLDMSAIEAEMVSAVGAGPNLELTLGMKDGSVVVVGPAGPTTFALDSADAVTAMSWSPSGDTLIATTNGERAAVHVCRIESPSCSRTEMSGAAGGRLVRGVPTPPAADEYYGLWPENTIEAADAAAGASGAASWRFEPALLVAEFARTVLEWSDPLVSPSEGFAPYPYLANFEVRPAPGQPTVTIGTAQLAGESGWVIAHVASPSPRFSNGFSAGGPITVGFDRLGASSVEVTVTIGDDVMSQSSNDLDLFQFPLEGSLDGPASYLVLFKDEEGHVFAANFGDLGGGLPVFVAVG